MTQIIKYPAYVYISDSYIYDSIEDSNTKKLFKYYKSIILELIKNTDYFCIINTFKYTERTKHYKRSLYKTEYLNTTSKIYKKYYLIVFNKNSIPPAEFNNRTKHISNTLKLINNIPNKQLIIYNKINDYIDINSIITDNISLTSTKILKMFDANFVIESNKEIFLYTIEKEMSIFRRFIWISAVIRYTLYNI